MFKFIKFQENLAPEDKSSGSSVIEEPSKDDIIKMLGEDDDVEDKEVIDLETKKVEKKEDDKEEDLNEDEKEETEEDEDEEDDELKEIEDELDDEEVDDEKLELVASVPKREILSKYPKLFKDFPFLEQSYYREREYTSIFPTIQEAREATEAVQILQKFEGDLKDGNFEVALQVIKNESPNNFNKVIDGYLDILGKVDKDAKVHVYTNVLKQAIHAMATEGRSSDNEALSNAALIVNQFLFGSSKFEPPQKLSKIEDEKPDEEKTKFEKEKQEFTRQRFETTRDEVNTRVQNSIRTTIDINIDPKNEMTAYVRKAAVTEAYDKILESIGKDDRFKALNDRLWDKAFKSNFNSETKDQLKKACISKARTLLPSVIKTARINALKGMGKRVREETREAGNGNGTDKKKSENRSTPQRERVNANEPKPGESALDFLMRD